MVIGTCSFGSTGSSVVTDFLCEYINSVQVLDKLEFTWVSEVDGLLDLEYHLMHPHCRTADSISAIERYRAKVRSGMRYYIKKGGLDIELFKASTEKFLDSITQLKWDWYLPHPESFLQTYIVDEIVKRRVIPRIERKKGRRIACWPMEEICFSVKPSNFEDAARKHVMEMLKAIGADFSKPVALDQPFAGNNPQACFKYFEDPYAIVVDRDPRDNYIFANTKLIGMTHFMPIQPVEAFVTYYRALRDNQPYKEPHERVLQLKFEDMVYHYDETTTKIREFLNLPENPNPKSVFDPSMSMANTQLWKRFPQYKKDIDYIEKELSEYLFDYTGCPEPDLNSKMFQGKSPKHK